MVDHCFLFVWFQLVPKANQPLPATNINHSLHPSSVQAWLLHGLKKLFWILDFNRFWTASTVPYEKALTEWFVWSVKAKKCLRVFIPTILREEGRMNNWTGIFIGQPGGTMEPFSSLSAPLQLYKRQTEKGIFPTRQRETLTLPVKGKYWHGLIKRLRTLSRIWNYASPLPWWHRLMAHKWLFIQLFWHSEARSFLPIRDG